MNDADPRLTPRPSYAYRPGDHGLDEDESVPIWRYMDLPKFLSVLEFRSLFFARADKLGDPWEGSLTEREVERRREIDEKNERARRGSRLHYLTYERILALTLNRIVSCWHVNRGESMAMWRLYMPSGDGVALQSTVEKLAASLPQWDGAEKGRNEDLSEKELTIELRAVQYVDYSSSDMREDPIFRKRRSFSHERELRAVATDTTWGNSPVYTEDGLPKTRFLRGGDEVPVDLEKLLQKVYVSPDAPEWFADLVRKLVARFGLEVPVHQSDLARDPVF